MKYEKPGQPKNRHKTLEEKNHLNWVASQSCAICGCWPVEVHHVRSMAEKRNHFKAIPLCYFHHRGQEGIHHLGKKEFWRRFAPETELLRRLEENE